MHLLRKVRELLLSLQTDRRERHRNHAEQYGHTGDHAGPDADALDGQVAVFLVMAVAAAEVAVGLGIILAIFRHKETTDVDEINLLKW